MAAMSLQTGPIQFTEREARFLCRGGIGRLATVSPEGEPHVVPVVFEFDGRTIYFSGPDLEKSLKFRHLALDGRVAIVVDEVVSVSPWRARGVEVRGVAELHVDATRPYVRIVPLAKASWGL
ncbi:MAG: PPOX class F420-dependent oxidoreductase [Nitrososphaerales archaeon]|jgi:pyridoxamine 5'-phosphate oxidase family protein